MSELDFTNISALPDGKELIDMALSRFLPSASLAFNQKPQISPSVRNMFLRRVRFSALVLDEKLATALDEFPDLAVIRSLRDRICHIFDPLEYMRALCLIEVARDALRMIRKYSFSLLRRSDSLHGVRCLCIYVLGGMCTIISQIAPTLVYLEEIRPHLVALPAVDPNVERIEFAGYPRGGIDAHILRWLDRLEEAEGLSQADGNFGTSGRDLNPEEEIALIRARINRRRDESRPNVTSNANPSEM